MSSRYQQAGVNIDEAKQAVAQMKSAIESTYGPAVLSDVGAFGGLYDAMSLNDIDAPVLVASIDGVGTKTKVAARLNRWDTIGQDLVNHCINDILVQGASPLFFLDYVASDRLDSEQIAAVVSGMAQACRAAGCALLGGETAEMPGIYMSGEIDVVGSIVGVVNRTELIDGSKIEAGDVLIALPATGLHTNGFTLARSVLDSLDWREPHPALGMSIGDALLAVHPCYREPIRNLRTKGIEIRGLAHITGGGVIENLPRILPGGLGADVQLGTWDIPPIFSLIQETGKINTLEMYRVFNMGLGMVMIIPAGQSKLVTEYPQVGEIVSSHTDVNLRG